MKLTNSLILTVALLFSTLSNATVLNIEDAYVRATPPHTQNSAAFMLINNSSDEPLTLISASSDIADRVELHSHIMSDGMMKMRQVESITVDAKGSTELRPGSFHVMFLGLKSPLTEGDSVNLKLHFSNGDEIVIDAPIKKITMQKKTMKHTH
ncbi:copper chaperone PCu(A)C [Psychromonas sp. KJ10-10]|uniref:copper chaperone PCu(A)C n=1 Tax=Psychromonas sp. KJ10-10 TaxID=3391823 RepID=UPI0039B45BC0